MKNTIRILGTILSIACLSSVSHADDVKVSKESHSERADDGSFKGQSESDVTDATGTRHVSKVDEKRTVGSDGKVKIASRAEASTDPKGLMNKTWDQRESTEERDSNGNFERKAKADSIDTAGTRKIVEESVKSTHDSDGNEKTTLKRKTVTDPKGLMNKKVTETEEVTKRNADGSVSKSEKQNF